MGEMTVGDMSAQYMDVLKELGNIGAGNAATALAELLNCKVDMSVPQVKLINFSQIGEVIGGEEQECWLVLSPQEIYPKRCLVVFEWQWRCQRKLCLCLCKIQ